MAETGPAHQLSSKHPSKCCSLWTWLNGSVPALAPPSPQKPRAFLFPVNSARPVSSLQLLVKTPLRARRFCTVAVAALCVCSSQLGKAGFYLQISLLQMQGRWRKPYAKPWPKEEDIPVGNLAPGLSWLLAFCSTDSVHGGGPAAWTPTPLSTHLQNGGGCKASPLNQCKPLWWEKDISPPNSSPSYLSQRGVLEAPTLLSLQMGDVLGALEVNPELRFVSCVGRAACSPPSTMLRRQPSLSLWPAPSPMARWKSNGISFGHPQEGMGLEDSNHRGTHRGRICKG